MKSTSLVRKTDGEGRISLPIELRRNMDIEYKDGMEFLVDDEKIILRKYEPACVFCGNVNGITKFKGKNVCKECLDAVRKRVL